VFSNCLAVDFDGKEFDGIIAEANQCYLSGTAEIIAVGVKPCITGEEGSTGQYGVAYSPIECIAGQPLEHVIWKRVVRPLGTYDALPRASILTLCPTVPLRKW
jgi:hypothetical protein